MADALVEAKTYQTHGRFYENEFPGVGDSSLVLARLDKFDDKSGCYVTLLEYGGREGMINLGEISKKRVRSMLKILRIGSLEVLSVMDVDEEKGYINLSKKRVEPEDVEPKKEQFAKAKAVHGIMQHVAANHGLEVEDLCEKVSWPLHTKYGCAFTAFKRHIDEEINIWEDVDFTQPGKDLANLADKIKEEIEMHMKRRLVVAAVRLMAKCEVSCHDYEGIDAIKEALQEGLKASKDGLVVEIKLIAHPVFALTCMCMEKEKGVGVLSAALDSIKASIESKKGKFSIISQPQIQKKEEQKDEDGSDAEGDSDSDGEKSYKSQSDAEDQDVGMGDLDEEQIKALEAAKVDDE
jgi:translation initiation factor 2 subunit 1